MSASKPATISATVHRGEVDGGEGRRAGMLRGMERLLQLEVERGDIEVRRFVELRGRQEGAFTRAQAVAHGIDDCVLARRCRNRQIQRIHQGVYADFTGPLPWPTRVWAAWLACGPEAALTGDTALRWHGLSGDWDHQSIHLAVPQSRRMERRSGVRISRHQNFSSWLLGGREPGLVRLEVAVLTAAARRAPDRRAALVLDICRQRRTTPERLLTELNQLPRLRGRAVLLQVLSDAASGVQSYLEQTYLSRVERAHRAARCHPAGPRDVRHYGQLPRRRVRSLRPDRRARRSPSVMRMPPPPGGTCAGTTPRRSKAKPPCASGISWFPTPAPPPVRSARRSPAAAGLGRSSPALPPAPSVEAFDRLPGGFLALSRQKPPRSREIS